MSKIFDFYSSYYCNFDNPKQHSCFYFSIFVDNVRLSVIKLLVFLLPLYHTKVENQVVEAGNPCVVRDSGFLNFVETFPLFVFLCRVLQPRSVSVIIIA